MRGRCVSIDDIGDSALAAGTAVIDVIDGRRRRPSRRSTEP
jgi:hypothetical protein